MIDPCAFSIYTGAVLFLMVGKPIWSNSMRLQQQAPSCGCTGRQVAQIPERSLGDLRVDDCRPKLWPTGVDLG